MKKTILLAEDDPRILEGLKKFLMKKDYEVFTAPDGARALKIAQREDIHLILADLLMPRLDGIQLLKKVKESKSHIQVILMTAHGTIEKAVEAMKEGAYDFLTKPLDLKKMELLVEKALEKGSLLEENIELQNKLRDKFGFKNIVGRSNAMKKVFEVIKQVSPRRSNILIYGESGTGKELVANAIHYSSPRVPMPFIKVNCSALGEGVLESELFGHEKGSFTGALSRRLGRFELANGGTLFLDEVGTLSPNLQTKLLRAIQEREFERVGGEKTIKVDVRLIAATNLDLKKALQDGRFREDLYYRLNVVAITLPPLRERREDIPFLVDHFIRKYNKENHLRVKGISPKVLRYLIKYPWPGNIRELENCIESAIVFTSGDLITPDQLPDYIKSPALQDNHILFRIGTPLKEVEKEVILKTLHAVGNSRTRAAKSLEIGVRTIHRKLHEYGF
jgi:DNA-binding NtrC family response regulator